LPSGRDAQQAMFDAIDEARDHIDLQYFTFADVRLGDWHLSELLIEKMGSRVAVNIVYDAYDSRDTSESPFAALRKAGACVVEFNLRNPLPTLTGHSLNDRDHRKMLVVDGRIGFVGGVNLALVYGNPPADGFAVDGNVGRAVEFPSA
jgi:cardiolipin synthase